MEISWNFVSPEKWEPWHFLAQNSKVIFKRHQHKLNHRAIFRVVQIHLDCDPFDRLCFTSVRMNMNTLPIGFHDYLPPIPDQIIQNIGN